MRDCGIGRGKGGGTGGRERNGVLASDSDKRNSVAVTASVSLIKKNKTLNAPDP